MDKILKSTSVLVLLSCSGWQSAHAASVLFGIGQSGTLYTIDTSTGNSSSAYTPPESSFVNGLTYDSENDRFVTIEGSGSNEFVFIDRLSGSYAPGGAIGNFPGDVNFSFPAVTGLTQGPNNNIVGTTGNVIGLINGLDFTNDSIFRINSNNAYNVIQTGSGGSYNNGITYDNVANEFYISQNLTPVISRVTPNLDSEGFVESFQHQFSDIAAVAMGPIAADPSGGALYGITADSNTQSLVLTNIGNGTTTVVSELNLSETIVGLTFANFDPQNEAPKPEPLVDITAYIFPLKSDNNVYLNTEAGGDNHQGGTTFTHTELQGYYSLDIDVNDGNAEIIAAKNGNITYIGKL